MSSNDFAFVHLDKNPARIFPLSWDEVKNEELNGKLPWNDFRNWLLFQGGRGNDSVVVVDYGENGSIYYQLSEECIFLDNHAALIEVLKAYRFLLTIYENAYVFSFEGGTYENEKSLTDWVDAI
ncbi:hypothetical protein HRE53_05660 [Acaryochloris sp. 'Moss Beach']|uniref:hypothetical protein n=1 Tax=Acaryochloris sp. 'Moss Beach' TaxID=2740837 RepID=UPI001F33CF84|nr:hypothetical protein [Acaryochloris sp. 'Moss Beach']UJB70572.1 hypothetical protein HRE53_05660 [Acaryochloris sp. 'Moss Beach']